MASDVDLLDALRAGDEQAFRELTQRYHARLLGLARRFVANREAAEDVVQDTWLAVFTGVERFEGRSSLRSWLFQICVNRARSSGVRERRLVPVDTTGPAVDAGRFGPDGGWLEPPTPWTDRVDDRLEADALIGEVRQAIERLPDSQALVVTLRDVEGLTNEEVCAVLSITVANERVLLHRGRSAVRRAVEAAVGP